MSTTIATKSPVELGYEFVESVLTAIANGDPVEHMEPSVEVAAATVKALTFQHIPIKIRAACLAACDKGDEVNHLIGMYMGFVNLLTAIAEKRMEVPALPDYGPNAAKAFLKILMSLYSDIITHEQPTENITENMKGLTIERRVYRPSHPSPFVPVANAEKLVAENKPVANAEKLVLTRASGCYSCLPEAEKLAIHDRASQAGLHPKLKASIMALGHDKNLTLKKFLESKDSLSGVRVRDIVVYLLAGSSEKPPELNTDAVTNILKQVDGLTKIKAEQRVPLVTALVNYLFAARPT